MKIFSFIVLVLSLIGILEYKQIIPSELLGVLLTLSNIAEFIKSLQIHSYYLILPNVSITIEGILILFLVLFISGYILERFRSLEQSNKVLNKKIQEITRMKSNHQTDVVDSKDDMKDIASEIKNFLGKLAESISANPSTPIRSKKLRRVSSEAIKSDVSSTESIMDASNVNEDKDIGTKKNTDDSVAQSVTADSTSTIINSSAETNSLSTVDDDLSNIDLAKALIQSDEKEKAREVLLDIIKNGTSEDAHEARILNLQIS